VNHAGPRVTVLGPQRRPTLGQVFRAFPADAVLATVTAGWQEREPEDAELDALLGGRSVNLELHRRWLDVLDRDHEFAVAELEHRAALDELQELYLVQLDAALRSLHEVARHGGGRPRIRSAALADAETVVRLVDDRHLARVREAQQGFAAAWRPEQRPLVAGHRAAVRRLLENAAALVVAGGHVGVLVHLLRLFQVGSPLPATVAAWSAGAMALTDRVLLFHDRAPQGPAHPEFYDAGLGLIRGCVLLPHARRRLHLDDLTRMSVLARRAAPARCVVLDDGVRVDLDPDGALPASTRIIAPDGHLVALEAA
jgi:hypothetical protein